MTVASGAGERERLAVELSELEAELVQHEMELASLQADFAGFQRRYLEDIGRRLERIDEIEAATEQAITDAESRSKRVTLKQLYRRLAKRLHPDLATSEDGRAIRTAWMARLNDAYSKGDQSALEALEQDLDSTGLEVEQSAQLSGLRMQIAQIRRRLAEITAERQRILSSTVGELWAESEGAAAEGRDLLAEMACELDTQIRKLEAQLAKVRVRA